MSKTYELEARFSLIDGVSAKLGNLGMAGTALNDKMKGLAVGMQRRLDSLGRVAQNVLSYAIYDGMRMVGSAMRSAAGKYIEFNESLVKSGALFDDLDSKAEDYQDRVAGLGKAAREVAKLTEFTATETMEALGVMAQAGLTSDVAKSMLPQVAELATAAGVGLAEAVDIGLSEIKAFGLDETADNFLRVADTMAMAANKTAADFVPMFEAMKNAAPAFRGAGQEIETLAASIGVLSDTGIRGGEAGTQLNAVFTQLATDKKRASLEAFLGARVTDAQGNFLPLFDIVGMLEEKLAGLGNAERLGFLGDIFQVRGAKAMNVLINYGADNLRAFEEQLNYSAGSVSEKAAQMRQAFAAQLKLLGSAMEELGLKIVEAFEKDGKSILEQVTALINNFDPKPLIDGLRLVVSAIQELWDSREFIIGIGGAFGALFVFSKFMELHAWIVSIGGVTQLWAGAQFLLNTAMNANPIGLIIAGVAILVGLLVAVYRKFNGLESVLNVVKGIALGLSAMFTITRGLTAVFSPVVLVLTAIATVIHEVITNWGYAAEAFNDRRIGEGILRIGKLILSGILAPIQGLLEMLAAIPLVGNLFEGAARSVGSLRDSLRGIERGIEIEAVVETVVEPPVAQAAPILSVTLLFRPLSRSR
jgi:TP901 family phage tail tape measure protein